MDMYKHYRQHTMEETFSGNRLPPELYFRVWGLVSYTHPVNVFDRWRLQPLPQKCFSSLSHMVSWKVGDNILYLQMMRLDMSDFISHLFCDKSHFQTVRTMTKRKREALQRHIPLNPLDHRDRVLEHEITREPIREKGGIVVHGQICLIALFPGNRLKHFPNILRIPHPVNTHWSWYIETFQDRRQTCGIECIIRRKWQLPARSCERSDLLTHLIHFCWCEVEKRRKIERNNLIHFPARHVRQNIRGRGIQSMRISHHTQARQLRFLTRDRYDLDRICPVICLLWDMQSWRRWRIGYRVDREPPREHIATSEASKCE